MAAAEAPSLSRRQEATSASSGAGVASLPVSGNDFALAGFDLSRCPRDSHGKLPPFDPGVPSPAPGAFSYASQVKSPLAHRAF
jgi:hypothetical protein